MGVVNFVIIFVSSFLTILVLCAEEAAIDCNAIKCPIAEYDPVCAYDPNRKCYQQFNGGYCEVIIVNCQRKDKQAYEIIKHEPCCSNTDTPQCDENCSEICPDIYDPVCACNKNGCQTFGNKCEMDAQNCKYDYDYKARYRGECGVTCSPDLSTYPSSIPTYPPELPAY